MNTPKLKDLIEIIELYGEDCPRGNSKTMGGLLAHCIESYEDEHGSMLQSAYLMKYVRTCMNNNVEKKGVDTIGYVQLIKFVKSWARTAKFK
ncbi:hypothetical protein [Vibrio vulnificus]|uniref:hypothetical protein n=1 Tax=Vibrio vulnificus TaxID=672 RepID=UPI001029B53C|nr:hypothetical protein [Vibrio vulnificus]EGR0128890.1 hypothetical protein [Vibrio vulnificus]MCU8153971.1 hypothetical protein [Vibrio vulnificus]RZP86194.1 hypothetical protein D8T56_20770 [Vibrio vulnificus]RZQ28341.1 hypothetical protein D8T42_17865 [Vibrio vulnificus]RZQ76329.1 hypothetical protein D8T31_17495 [Vibrio vulnificus]